MSSPRKILFLLCAACLVSADHPATTHTVENIFWVAAVLLFVIGAIAPFVFPARKVDEKV